MLAPVLSWYHNVLLFAGEDSCQMRPDGFGDLLSAILPFVFVAIPIAAYLSHQLVCVRKYLNTMTA